MHYIRRGKRYIVTGHREGGRFIDVLKWQFGSRPARWPRHVANAAHPPPPPDVHGDSLRATWLGHSTVLIQTAGLNIITDPFLSQRASPFRFAGPRRVRPAPFLASQLPHIDAVLLSHNHYDHLDAPGLKTLLQHHSPQFFTPLGNGRYLQRVSRSLQVQEMDWRESATFKGLTITVMPAQHWSKRGLGDANHALWGAFAVEAAGGVVYFAGDTGFGDGSLFREVRERFGRPRLSLLPIGAYEPRWFMKAMHMNPEDAVMAHRLLESRTSLGIHHATVQLTNESIDQPVKDLAQALAAHGVSAEDFKTVDVGEAVLVS